MKHTPGPWRMGQEGNLRVYGPDNTSSAGLIAETFNRENARLIAAAPELLEACKAALAEAEERDEDLGANCWPELKAAIEKAEGVNG